MIALFSIASAAYLYTIYFKRFFVKQYKYTILKINKVNDVVEIIFDMRNLRLKFKPGQFIMVKFPALSNEAHPFTIASAPDEEFLRLSIKKSGDYTNKLEKLSNNDLALITGPYGRIYDDFAFNKDIVCIAGGIGITPFLSLFRSQQVKETKTAKYLFYSVKDSNQAIYDHELEEISQITPNLKYNLWVTSEMGYINAQKIAEIAKDLKNKIIYICGPQQMAFALIDQFRKLGIKNRQIKFEEFSFR
jgi:predicted ferric reductase